MRAIKYRGKRKHAPHEWLIGDLNHMEDGIICIFNRIDPNGPLHSADWFEVDPDTIGMFSGHLDAAGNEIYEGDVLAFDSINPMRREPYMHERRLVKWCHAKDNGSDIEGLVMPQISYGTLLFVDNQTIKVIGNIHENPELIEP